MWELLIELASRRLSPTTLTHCGLASRSARQVMSFNMPRPSTLESLMRRRQMVKAQVYRTIFVSERM